MEHDSVARGASSLYVASIGTLLSAMVYFVVLTNYFHSTLLVGVVTALNILIWFLVLFSVLATPIVNQNAIPAPLAVLKFIPEMLVTNDRYTARKILTASLTISLVVSLLIAALLMAATPTIIQLLDGSAVLPIDVYLAAVDVIAVSLGAVGLAAVIATGKARLGARYIWLWAISRYALASVLMVPLGVIGVLVGWILGDLLLVLLSLRRSFADLARYVANASEAFPTRRFLSYNMYSLGAALIGFAMNQADRILTLTTQGVSPLAVYNVAIVASSVAGSAAYALVTVMLPAVAALFAARRFDALHRLIRSNTRYLSILVMPIAFGLAAVMEIPLRIFGAAYVSGIVPAVIVCVASGLTAVSAIYASALLALGRMRWFTAANLLGLVGFLVLAWLLTPSLGLSGPAVGRAALMAITTMIYALVASLIGVFEFDLKAYLVSTACSSIMAVPIYIAVSSIQTFYLKLAALPFLIMLGLVIYLGLLRASHLLSKDDLEFLRAITPQRLHRWLPLLARIVGVAG
ncbi:MAG TPA: lipopolysaccharide biosynthesis protein [Terriglobales bacterium]|nr:lipopolysaccharide biosynthesis protein [Terriglobales bacterium]